MARTETRIPHFSLGVVYRVGSRTYPVQLPLARDGAHIPVALDDQVDPSRSANPGIGESSPKKGKPDDTQLDFGPVRAPSPQPRTF